MKKLSPATLEGDSCSIILRGFGAQAQVVRTFPHHEFFTDGQGIGQENLFNVLKAYSLCVGMSDQRLLPG